MEQEATSVSALAALAALEDIVAAIAETLAEVAVARRTTPWTAEALNYLPAGRTSKTFQRRSPEVSLEHTRSRSPLGFPKKMRGNEKSKAKVELLKQLVEPNKFLQRKGGFRLNRNPSYPRGWVCSSNSKIFRKH